MTPSGPTTDSPATVAALLSPEPYVLILTAVRMEANAIADALKLKKTLDGGHQGAFSGKTVILRSIGIHAVAMHAIDPHRTSCVILAGLAGGLDPTLKSGEIVAENAPERFRPHWPLHRGKIVCSSVIVGDVHAKASLFQSTGALAVEMESDAVRQAASLARVPFIHIRAILDTARESLDPALSILVDSHGSPHYRKVAGFLLRNPIRVLSLLRLGKSSKRSCAAVAFAVNELLLHIPG